MRHDYDLPPDWDAMSDDEKSRWFSQERCRRQAMAQQTPTREELEYSAARLARVLSARGYEPIAAHR